MFKLARVCVCVSLFGFGSSCLLYVFTVDLTFLYVWTWSLVILSPVLDTGRFHLSLVCLSVLLLVCLLAALVWAISLPSFLPFLFSPSLRFVVSVCLCTAACYEALIYVALTFIPYLLIFYWILSERAWCWPHRWRTRPSGKRYPTTPRAFWHSWQTLLTSVIPESACLWQNHTVNSWDNSSRTLLNQKRTTGKEAQGEWYWTSLAPSRQSVVPSSPKDNHVYISWLTPTHSSRVYLAGRWCTPTLHCRWK